MLVAVGECMRQEEMMMLVEWWGKYRSGEVWRGRGEG
jgi:hypothetical protein